MLLNIYELERRASELPNERLREAYNGRLPAPDGYPVRVMLSDLPQRQSERERPYRNPRPLATRLLQLIRG